MFINIIAKHIKPHIFILLVLVCIGCAKQPEKTFVLTNESVEAHVFKLKDGQLAYSIKKNNEVVIDTSTLGITVDKVQLGKNCSIHLQEKGSHTVTFPLLGVKNTGTLETKEFVFNLTETSGFQWQIIFKISKQGAAYRYIIENKETQIVNEELSSFKLPEQTKVWYFERNSDWKLKSHAGEWLSADISKMPTVSSQGPIQGLTLTLELPQKSYALIGEASLFNYSGSRLKAIGNNTFKTNFTEGENGFSIEGKVISPWRVILLADNLNDLVNNTMIAGLNPSPDENLFKDTSWIKPGKSVWHWWSKKHATFDAEMKMIDDAVALGLDYSMVDEGWELWDDKWKATTDLCAKAKANDIGVFLWKHSKELNFPSNNYELMDRFLDSVKMTGAVGVKVDFMNGQSKNLIDFDENLLKKTAKRQLMVNFHGCQHSSGEYRTYPNEVTREGIRGIEVNGIINEDLLPASHNAALPFTRYISGHADYTPIGFTNPGETTWAHQLATLICFYSPFQCIAENTEFLLSSKEILPSLDFIKEVPSVWDETVVLPQSKIGELAILARRKGNDWYLGILSSGSEKTIEISCDFLNTNDYQVDIFSDDLMSKKIDITDLHPRQYFKEFNQATPFKKESKTANKATSLSIKLAKNGGTSIWFKSTNKTI